LQGILLGFGLLADLLDPCLCLGLVAFGLLAILCIDAT
jgi:hypothetical protein